MSDYTKLDTADILKFIFHPNPNEIPPPENGVDVDITVSEELLLGCRFYRADKSGPIILLFHGNGETVSDYNSIAPHYLEHGINFFVATYRGYGRSGGIPTVSDLFGDAKIVYSYVRQMLEDEGYTGPLFVMGRSLGSAPALDLAKENGESITGIIVESGFADTLPLLQNLGLPTDSLQLEETEGFGNRDKIAEIKVPTLLLHGANDLLIPVPQAEKLQSYSGAKTKKFFIIPGAGHNTTIAVGGEHYFRTIKSFIDEIIGKVTWRERRKKYKENRK